MSGQNASRCRLETLMISCCSAQPSFIAPFTGGCTFLSISAYDSNIILTLHNHSQPLLRYAMTP
ncbi:hypothetical protein [Pectobacterium wasabiae]|uniref:hypothetical protein n=1 Tax=Pectobacterium wasabiae TaxID=55208 RepID=UPI00030E0661|nr:hypothetical protein [Pectobacterium wasabiae]